jgi:hypothetical protein
LRGSPGLLEIGIRAAANQRQHVGERLQTIELRLIAMRAPRGMIAILLAALRIASGRLDVPALVWTDPHIRPGRRHGQRANAIEHGRVANRLSVGAKVDEPISTPPALDAGLFIAYIAESRRRRCGERTGIRPTFGPAGTGRSKGANAAHEELDRAKLPPSEIRTGFRRSALSSPSEF